MTRVFRSLIFLVTAFLFFQLISLYLSWPKQVALGGCTILLGLVANRLSKRRLVTLALVLISMTATFRYAWWRVHTLVDYFSDESNNRTGFDAAFILLLISAEAYTMVIMVLGYMQTVRPLRRMPIPMPADVARWPHVDILIPTYNESLALVRYTALAAINIDYPPEKLHVYILDDGTRAEFKEFSREAGVGYVTRVEHGHAKAGNINHALTTMDSPFVAIFDCDHVPTRSFLQMTLGWMLADPQLAMMQTPHHFYSPDPFERNLLQYKTIPNEAELFYGIVQDGNDLWNATFFCGSCALLRRTALDEVGGIAVETVTEDAHTSLRMQKLGYNTAYINIPQAAGLATETLAAHVGQRIRWARGMIQIFRTDNPLFGGKLKISQRLCYFNAMAHFLYAVPRLIFLLSPLVYLLLGRTIIPGYWIAILAYALPHLILASLTNSRIQGRHRHSFWNEIYEAVLAPYILAPTLLAFINPKLGKFNVTDKGSTLSATRFDKRIATPTRWLLFLNFLGVLAVPYRLFFADTAHPGAVIMNLVWVVFNIVILGVAAAVAHEQKQRRESVRIEARIRVVLTLPSGRQIEGMTNDMSVGGASVRVPTDVEFTAGSNLLVVFPEIVGDENSALTAEVAGLRRGEVRLAFLLPTIAEQETLTRALYSRADAWIGSLENKELDRPLVSLGRVIRLSGHGLFLVLRSIFPQRSARAKAEKAALVLLAVALAAGMQGSASSQSPAAAIAGSSGSGTTALGGPGSAAQEAPANGADSDATILSLKDMGATNSIEMRGPHSYDGLHFTLAHALVPRHATLRLTYSLDATLDPHATWLRVSVNGTVVATLLPDAISEGREGLATAVIPVPDTLLVRSNSLTFEFTGSGVMQREEDARTHVFCRISQASTLEVSGDRLRLENDLGKLPLPIFDTELQTPTTIPIVFLSKASAKLLEASGAVVSWLGLSAGNRPVRFSVASDQIPTGNAIVFSSERSALPASLLLPQGSGPLLALRNNPTDPYGSVLIVTGDDEDQVLMAAQALSLTRSATATTPPQGLPLSGDTQQISSLALPRPRARDDAPRWMPMGKASPLASCQVRDQLETDGSAPVPVYFHVPPDLYYGERENLKLHLNYRYDARPIVAGSALRVYINGYLVNEAQLAPGKDFANRQREILIPVSEIRPFGNTLLFSFDFIPANREAVNTGLVGLSGEILCNSTLDLQGLSLWKRMPDLEVFSNAGFPFTRVADLAETTVVLPAEPTAAEMGLYLNLMGHFGAQTGYPALRVTVAGPGTTINAGRDYLILGTLADQPAFNSLATTLPVTMDASGVSGKPLQGFTALFSSFRTQVAPWLSNAPWITNLFPSLAPERVLSNDGGATDALIEEIQSPSSPDRSIVVIALRQDAVADPFEGELLDRSQSGEIAGSVSLLRNGKFDSYVIDGQAYHVGKISWYAMMRIWLTAYFLPLLLVVTALSFLLARWIRGWLNQQARSRLRLAEEFAAREDSEDS